MSEQRNMITRFLSRQRRWVSAGVAALGVSGLVVGGLAGPAAATSPLPTSVSFSQFADVDAVWTSGELGFSGAHAGTYAEGETVPFLLDVTSAGAGTWTFSICRDYQNGADHGYLSLLPYNTSRNPVLAGVVTDAATGAAQPFSGAALGGSVHIDSVTELGGQGGCDSGQRETQVQVTAAGIGGLDPLGAYVLWGGHLASPADAGVTVGHGAGAYNGATLHMQVITAKKTLPAKVAEAGAITVQKVVDSGPATADQFCFNISPNPAGITLPLCPAAGQDTVAFLGLTTGNYTVTEAGLNGYTYASGSGPANCQVSNGSAVATVTATGDTTTDATCVFHNRRQQGTLTVIDVLNPGTDPGRFNLQIDGSTAGTGGNVGDGGTTGAIVVSAGSHGVGVMGGANTDIGGYTSSVSCVDTGLPVVGGLLGGSPVGGLLGGNSVPVTSGTVNVADGQNVVCTVTLTPVPAETTTTTAKASDPVVDDPTTTTTTTQGSDPVVNDPTTTTTTTQGSDPVVDDSTTTTTVLAPVVDDSTTTTTVQAPVVDDSTTTTTVQAPVVDDSTTTTTEQVIVPTTIIDNLPDPVVGPSNDSTTTTTIKKRPKPTDDDNPGPDDDGWIDDAPSTTTSTTTITVQAPVVDPGTIVAGNNDQAGAPAPEQVLAGELERPAPAANPAPSPMPAATLPRTGRGIGGEVLAAFGLLIAGLALRVSQRRKPAGER